MMKLVELQGSEKQVAWAKDIRDSYVINLEDFVTLSEKKLRGEQLTPSESGRLSGATSILVGYSHRDKYEEIYANVWNEEFEQNTFEFWLGRVPKDRKAAMAFRQANREAFNAYKKLKEREWIKWVKETVEKDLMNPSAKFWIENKR